MADRFPGGVISKTPPTVVAPVDGEGGSASGVWTLDEQLGLQKAGSWPGRVLPRELYTWGGNTFGQVGDGSIISRSSSVQVGALDSWAQVSAGYQHTLATTFTGTLFSWGRNDRGQLGLSLSPAVSRSSPVQVGALTNWAQVSAGVLHTACVKTDNTLWTWGHAANGRLGHNNTAVNLSSPVQVGSLTDWAQVSAGNDHTACVKTDSTLWAWGNNGQGQLGLGNALARSSPVQIGSLINWAQVSAGNGHTACVTTAGTLFTWGVNGSGQLGLNDTPNKSSPVQVGALTNWSQVSAGGNHTACVTTAGTLFTWGYNARGTLGLGNTTGSSSPAQVGALTNWAQVSAGGNHTACVTTAGTLFTWGYGVDGRLGQGSTASRSSPVQVGALTNWSQVSASDQGGIHTAAITKGT